MERHQPAPHLGRAVHIRVHGARLLIHWYKHRFANLLEQIFFSPSGLQPDKYRCKIPACDDGVSSPSFSDVTSTIFPLDDDDDKDYCKYYPPRRNATSETCSSSSVFDLDASAEDCKTAQGNFIYDDFEMDSTVVTEWDLVCDNQYKVSFHY